jgi:Uma2 family endonuclease
MSQTVRPWIAEPPGGWTAEAVIALPDDRRRYELIDGELLVTASVSFAHQHVLGELMLRLYRYTADNGIGDTLPSPADLVLDPRTLVKPDLFVLPRVNGRRILEWSDVEGRLLLAIEVMSPATARADRLIKRRRFQRAGIEYWVVDIEARLVERWRPDDERPEIVAESLIWQPDPAIAPLSIDVPEVFARALDR